MKTLIVGIMLTISSFANGQSTLHFDSTIALLEIKGDLTSLGHVFKSNATYDTTLWKLTVSDNMYWIIEQGKELYEFKGMVTIFQFDTLMFYSPVFKKIKIESSVLRPLSKWDDVIKEYGVDIKKIADDYVKIKNR